MQLRARLEAERKLRDVAIVYGVAAPRFEAAVRAAISSTGARAIHVEGTSGVPLEALLRLRDADTSLAVSVHDMSLAEQGEPARRLLESAVGLIFPSPFLRDSYRRFFSMPLAGAEVIAPAVPGTERRVELGGERRGIAFAGAVMRHKGAHLLPELARALAGREIELYVFGGGDPDLFRSLRKETNVIAHGYYRNPMLPSLLARHGVGLVVLPSIVPEAYCLVLSEAWIAGAAVAAFDLGAQGERIRREGGGWVTPLESGAAGVMEIVERWLSGERSETPLNAAMRPADAARAHIDLYRRWGLLAS